MNNCKFAKKYKGIYPPRCNGGNPCEECKRKYYKRMPGIDESRKREMGKVFSSLIKTEDGLFYERFVYSAKNGNLAFQFCGVEEYDNAVVKNNVPVFEHTRFPSCKVVLAAADYLSPPKLVKNESPFIRGSWFRLLRAVAGLQAKAEVMITGPGRFQGPNPKDGAFYPVFDFHTGTAFYVSPIDIEPM